MLNLIFPALSMSIVLTFGLLHPLKKVGKIWRVMMGTMVIIVFLGCYAAWGGWREYLLHQRLLSKHAQAEALLRSMGDVQTVIEKLHAKVIQEPEKAKGWYLLGRLYASQNRWLEARGAFMKAYQLQPEHDEHTLNLAQSLFAIGSPDTITEARVLLQSYLKKHPTQLDALAMLAMEANQRKSFSEAVDYWRRMLVLLPPNAELAVQVRLAIEKARRSQDAM